MKITIVTLFVCLLGVSNLVYARYSDRDVLALARCLVAECDRCDRHPDEKAAIAWVLKKRMDQYNKNHDLRQRDYYTQVHAYCSVFSKTGWTYYLPRAVDIRRSTFVNPYHIQDPVFWDGIRQFIISFFDGEIADPLPSAMHFGGQLDIPLAIEKSLVFVTKYCNEDGKWCNYFYRTSLLFSGITRRGSFMCSI